MSDVPLYTIDEVLELADPLVQSDVAHLIGRVHARGDSLAVYENRDMGHPELGHLYFLSYGSPASQIKQGTAPEVLPDIGGIIGWRYWLKGVCKPS